MSAVALLRFTAPAAIASAAALVGAVAAPFDPEEAAALHADDACAADATGEGCATSLLQLRGTQRAAEQLNATGVAGFCCYASAGTDTCGSCFADAQAEQGSWCDAHHTCTGPKGDGGCGGTWCTMQCVFSWSDEEDKCTTHTSAADSDNWCAGSESRCEDSCNGAWCVGAAPASSGEGGSGGKGGKGASNAVAVDPAESGDGDAGGEGSVEEPDPSEGDDTEYGGISSTGDEDEEGYWGDSLLEVEEAGRGGKGGKGGENNSTAGRGFCCFAGDGDDKCGSCYPGARAPSGSWCASENKCGTCDGGTWCTMHCVLAHSDATDACNTAYAIAGSDDFCAQSEANCESQGGEGNGNCRGTWCGHTTVVS